jgi:hypothetical protein
MKKMSLAVAACTLLLLALSAGPAAASPEALTTQDKIDRVLAEFPGGEQLTSTTVAWDDGAALLTFESDSAARAIGSCATGSYCAWSGTSYTGTKMSFTGCSAGGTSSSLAALGGVVRSMANARSSGTVRAYNSNTLTRTIGAGIGVPLNTAAVTRMTCTS